MKKGLIFIALFVFGKLFAQFPHPDTAYFFLFGNNNVEEFRDVCNHSIDSGYVAVGTTSSFSNGASDIYLVKTDYKGTTLWSRHIGGNNIENGYAIEETYDKGFIIGGFTNTTPGGDYDMLLVKTDSNGFVQWQKTIGGADWDMLYSLAPAPDSGFVLCGETYSFGNASSNVYIVRTDKDGNVIWQRNYGGNAKDKGNEIIVTADTSIVVSGYTQSFGSGGKDLYLLRCLFQNGDTLFTRTYGGLADEEAISMAEHSALDGGYVMTGSTQSFNLNQDKDIFLIKYDSSGNFMWQFNFGSGGDDAAACLVPEGKKFFVSGYTANGAGVFDLAAGIIDSAGNWDWTQSASFGGYEADYAWAVLKTLRGDYLFCGSTRSFNSANGDGLFILVDSVKPIVPQKIVVSSDTLVSVEEIFFDEVRVFPNPVSSILHLTISGKDETHYELNDLIGRKVAEGSIIPGESGAAINVEGLPDGVYILRISTPAYNSSGKVIVRH